MRFWGYFVIQSPLLVHRNGGKVTIPTYEEQQRAHEDLAYIRQTMESASTFTAVSGWGLVSVGVIGLAAALVSWARETQTDLSIWVPAAMVAVATSALANAVKAKRLKVPLWTGSLRKIAWVMTPALAAGAVLTVALADQGAHPLLPGTWLALYGAGVTAGGTFSVYAIRWMGVALLILGALALLMPERGLVLLALGFGGLHVGFGLNIVKRYGG